MMAKLSSELQGPLSRLILCLIRYLFDISLNVRLLQTASQILYVLWLYLQEGDKFYGNYFLSNIFFIFLDA